MVEFNLAGEKFHNSRRRWCKHALLREKGGAEAWQRIDCSRKSRIAGGWLHFCKRGGWWSGKVTKDILQG